jgi:hypothetical protein
MLQMFLFPCAASKEIECPGLLSFWTLSIVWYSENTMFIIAQSDTIQYRHTVRYVLSLHVSTYCGHHQVHTVSYTHPLLMSAIPPYTAQCLHIGSVLFGYIALVFPLCYKMY